jgi:hypothetical protein
MREVFAAKFPGGAKPWQFTVHNYINGLKYAALSVNVAGVTPLLEIMFPGKTTKIPQNT